MIREKPTEDIKLVLKATGTKIDHRRYNLPTGTDIAVIMPTESEHILCQCDVCSVQDLYSTSSAEVSDENQ